MFRLNYLILIIFSLLSFSVQAKVHTVNTIPNIYKAKKLTFVSNPDFIIPDKNVNEINSKLIRLENDLSNEVAVVAVESIGKVNSRTFANKLFNTWKIGKSQTNNGLLILLITDIQEIVFETGTGLQETMTDDICFQIQQEWMIPHLKDGNFGEGLVAGVDGVIQFLKTGNPSNNKITEIAEANITTEPSESFMSKLKNKLTEYSWIRWALFGWFVCFAFALIDFMRLIFRSSISLTTKRTMLKSKLKKATFWLLVLGLNVGGVACLFVIYLLFLKFRNPQYQCLGCGSFNCKDLRPDTQKDYLTINERENKRRGIARYTVVECLECGYYNKKEIVALNYARCPHCNEFVEANWANTVLITGTSKSYGKNMSSLRCQHCKTISQTEQLVPILESDNFIKVSFSPLIIDDNDYRRHTSAYNKYNVNRRRNKPTSPETIVSTNLSDEDSYTIYTGVTSNNGS